MQTKTLRMASQTRTDYLKLVQKQRRILNRTHQSFAFRLGSFAAVDNTISVQLIRV